MIITVFKSLKGGLEELESSREIETIQTIALLRSDRILRRVLETLWGFDFTQTLVKDPIDYLFAHS